MKSHTRTKTALALLLCSLSLTTIPGCLLAAVGVGAAAGYGTYRYVKGELTTTEEIKLDRAWSATQAAIKEMQFPIKTERKDSLGAKMVAMRSDDKEITIALEADGETHTKFSIRVGTLGDEEQSRTIMDKIRKHY